MRLAIGIILAIACAVVIASPAQAAEHRQLRQTHTIDIEVECIETATAIIRELNGYNLESSIVMPDEFGWSQPSANFTRRVDEWAFRHVQEVLRGLGEVTFERESSHHLGAELMNTEIRLEAAAQEIERLSLMMAASDSLSTLIAIDSQLSRVMHERDRIIGTRNLLLSQASSPIIHIQLFESMENRWIYTPPTFGNRIVGSFMGSWRGLLSFGSNTLVGIVRISIPLAIWAMLLCVALIVGNRVRKKRRPPIMVPEQSPAQLEGGQDDEE